MAKWSLYAMAAFYLFAGSYHFINPDFYAGLIPDYLPAHDFLHRLAGAFELVFGLALFFERTRWWATRGILLMLLAFVPAHVHFIAIGSCIEGGLCVPPWIGWVRLVVIHPLLLYWAYRVGKSRTRVGVS
ncbi:MAG: hypothetical protein AAGB22_14515 [Bacteroidota bacterium]